MKFEIEIKDFWLDEEELNSALKHHITSTVVSQITKSIEDRVQTAITTRVEKAITSKISAVIDAKLSELVAIGNIMGNGKCISINEHVQNIFQSNTGWSNPRDQMVRLANDFGKALKAQYDSAFANRIVIAMKEQGMLKDEVVQMLLERK